MKEYINSQFDNLRQFDINIIISLLKTARDNKKEECKEVDIEEFKKHLLYNLTNVGYFISLNRFGLITRYTEEGVYFGRTLITYDDCIILNTDSYFKLEDYHNKLGHMVWSEPSHDNIKNIFSNCPKLFDRIMIKRYG